MAHTPRPSRRPRKPQGPAVNERIRASTLRVIGADGVQLGVMSRQEALRAAEEAGLDLLEVAPNANPPVCRIIDYGKYRYDQERKDRAQRRQRAKPPHHIKLRPQIAEHDYQTKLAQVRRFLAKGDLVLLTVQMRGRMNTHAELGLRLLTRFERDLQHDGKVEQPARHQGNQISMLMAPRTDRPA